jgi:hypothetical protein
MFILRRITSESIEINTCLNDGYVLTLQERNEKEFLRIAKSLKWYDEESIKDIYGFVSFNDGSSVMPLYQKSHYFVMGSDGRTFSNISMR